MRLWLIPSIDAGLSAAAGLAPPRLEHEYLAGYALGLSVSAYRSAASSGMMAPTGIVLSIVFVMVQLSAIACSPRLVIWFARDQTASPASRMQVREAPE